MAPFQPPLPRLLLAGRFEAIEAIQERLQPGDPRLARAQSKLERTKEELRIAGGRTRKRLFFTLVAGEERVKKAQREVEAAEQKKKERDEGVLKAIREAELAEKEVEAKKAVLKREMEAHAFRGFQAAAETGNDVGGYAELDGAVQRCGEALARWGECEAEWNHIARFVSTFARRGYEASDDSELADLRSMGAPSTPNDTEPEKEEQEREEVREEPWRRKWFERGGGGAQMGRSGAGEDESADPNRRPEEGSRSEMLAIQQASMVLQGAGLAPMPPQAWLHSMGERAGIGAGMVEGTGVGMGEGSAPPALAIMDAVDIALPPSSDSGKEGHGEPQRKRRGREVQIAGGNTSQDVCMQKESNEDVEGGEGKDEV